LLNLTFEIAVSTAPETEAINIFVADHVGRVSQEHNEQVNFQLGGMGFDI
jgi:hypothetical protein